MGIQKRHMALPSKVLSSDSLFPQISYTFVDLENRRLAYLVFVIRINKSAIIFLPVIQLQSLKNAQEGASGEISGWGWPPFYAIPWQFLMSVFYDHVVQSLHSECVSCGNQWVRETSKLEATSSIHPAELASPEMSGGFEARNNSTIPFLL